MILCCNVLDHKSVLYPQATISNAYSIILAFFIMMRKATLSCDYILEMIMLYFEYLYFMHCVGIADCFEWADMQSARLPDRTQSYIVKCYALYDYLDIQVISTMTVLT